MEKTIRDINSAAKVFLVLSMACVALTIVSSCIEIGNYNYFGWDTSILVKEIIIDVLILVASVLTFMKKRAGLIALVFLFSIRVFATIPQGGEVSIASHLGANSVPFLRDFGPFAIAMFFRKNGVSGWDALLSKENHHTNNSSKPTCIEENLKARNFQEVLMEEKQACFKSSSSQDSNGEEPLFDENASSQEIVIISNDSPVVPLNPSKEPLDDMISSRAHSEKTAGTIPPNSEKNRIAELEEENTLLKQMYADLALRMSRTKE